MAKPESKLIPSKTEKDPTKDNKFIFDASTLVCNENGKDIDEKIIASKKPVDSPKSTDLGNTVVSIKAENNVEPNKQKEQPKEVESDRG